MTDMLLSEAITLIDNSMEEASAAGERDVNAMSLATVSGAGRVSSRMVLLKGLSESGLVFYTNLESNKALQLGENASAAVVFHWKSIAKQLRVEGLTQPVSNEDADAYFASRDRGSQIGAWASAQSRPLESRETLEARIGMYEKKFEQKTVERPPYWSGYRLSPEMIELWEGRTHRLHVRWRYFLTQEGSWSKELLYP